MARLFVVGLNPALQKVLHVPEFKIGDVCRAVSKAQIASGKGINVAKVLRRLGHEVFLLQILGGETGRIILRECNEWGIHTINIPTSFESRTCVTVISAATESSFQQTEIIEPFEVEESLNDVIINICKDLGSLNSIYESPFKLDAMLFCGSLPKGISHDCLEQILALIPPHVTLLDAIDGFNPDFLSKINHLKINAQEYDVLVQKGIDPLHTMLPLDRLESLTTLDKPGTLEKLQTTIQITNGSGAATFYETDYKHMDKANSLNDGQKPASWNKYTFSIPPVSGILNCIGAGDTVTAGYMHYLLSGMNAKEAYRKALAMGSASCLKILPSEYMDKDVDHIFAQIKMQPEMF